MSMYLEHFGLKFGPFDIGSDPRFFFSSALHREAVARLTYLATVCKPLLVLTGEAGTGKTLVIEQFRARLDPSRFQVIDIQNPLLSVEDIFQEILRGAIGTAGVPSGKGEVLRLLREAFVRSVRAGRRPIVTIDEAHLAPGRLFFEEIRMLLNYHDAQRNLLSLVLIGQNELRQRIDEVPALRQRVALCARLGPLAPVEVPMYVRHRLKIAGRSGDEPIFVPEVFPRLYQHTAGIPRLINQVCDLALLTAAHRGELRVGGEIIEEALKEVPAFDSSAVPRP